MYNRYIPSEDGTYRHQRVESSEKKSFSTPSAAPPPITEAKSAPVSTGNTAHTPPCSSSRLDGDELLLVVILLLLLMDDQDEDMVILIAALAFLIL